MNVREKPGECPGQRRGRDCLRRSNQRLGPQAEVWKDAELRRQCRVQGAKVGRGSICRLLQAVLELVSDGSMVAGEDSGGNEF